MSDEMAWRIVKTVIVVVVTAVVVVAVLPYLLHWVIVR